MEDKKFTYYFSDVRADINNCKYYVISECIYNELLQLYEFYDLNSNLRFQKDGMFIFKTIDEAKKDIVTDSSGCIREDIDEIIVDIDVDEVD